MDSVFVMSIIYTESVPAILNSIAGVLHVSLELM